MSSTNRGKGRKAFDVYGTPAWTVRRLLEAVPLDNGLAWFEPCAGDGAIIRAVNAYRRDTGGLPFRWDAVELRPECEAALSGLGVRVTVGDFLTVARPQVRHSVAITNPPFSLAFDVVQRCVGGGFADTSIFLLRLNFLGSADRQPWFVEHPPEVYVLPNRPSFTGGGSDSPEYAWFIWRGDGYRPGAEGKLRVLPLTPKEERR